MRITLVDKNPYYTYLPFLPEVAGGHIAPKDVTVDLRAALRKTRVLHAAVVGISAASQTVTIRTDAGVDRTLEFDELIVALGSVSRVFPTPGLAEYAVGFKTVEEASFVRARLLRNIAAAASTKDDAERRRLLTGVFVGGGYTGVEAIGELLDTSNAAVASYPSLRGEKPRWVLIDALDRIAPEVGPQLSKWTLDALRSRGVDVRLGTTMPSVESGVVQLSDGDSFPAGLVVWTAGVKPNPVLEATDLPRGPKGHVIANTHLQVTDGTTHVPLHGIWALGDAAQVPDFTADHQPAFYVPNAQNAVRQAVVVADNVAAELSGKHLVRFRHPSIGTVASYGVGKGAANIKGVNLTNWPAWFLHRSYHVYAMPTVRRKLHILLGWVTGTVTGREATPIADEAAARAAFADASKN
jgi:NADH dehydrogenase